jgi:Transposase DDE domain
MVQSIITPLSRQLVTYRHQALAAPTMLDDGTLAPSHVAGVLAQEGVQGRNRLFPPQLTLWTFLLQVLSPDGSCREALSRLRPWMIAQGQTPCSPNTGSYCKARKRLPEGVVSTLARHSGQRLCEQTPEAWLWKGRRVKIVDGSTVSMPDTEANQAAYPQPRSQQPGVGFPLARLVAVFDLGSGALTTLGVGRYQGKATGEMALFRQQQHHLQRGDVVLADCYYSSYWTLAGLRGQGFDYVGRQHHRRTTDFRCGQRLGREDHRVEWCKPVKPAWMDQPTYAGLPDQLTVRELRVRVGRRGFRTQVFVVVTTLLDARLYSAHDIADLYGHRWHCELDLRSIKVALGMDVLRCRTPEMVRKELWMYVLAYNLIRAVMVRAALSQGLYPRQLSFTGALQAVNGFTPALVFAEGAVVVALLDALLGSVAAHRVGQRPNRVEPRAVKRRPKAHKLLSVPRLKARKRLESGRAA